MRKIQVGMIAVAMLTTVAQADVLIAVDLLTPNEVTISATDGLSAATVAGSDTIGFLLADFYTGGTASPDLLNDGVGDLTNFENPSDGNPRLFRASGGDTGLNVWSFSLDSTVTFTAGSQAFLGSATWTLDPLVYADMLAGNTAGDIYFPADDAGDIPGATLLGTWFVIPEPGSIAILSLGAIGLIRRRR